MTYVRWHEAVETMGIPALLFCLVFARHATCSGPLIPHASQEYLWR